MMVIDIHAGLARVEGGGGGRGGHPGPPIPRGPTSCTCIVYVLD